MTKSGWASWSLWLNSLTLPAKMPRAPGSQLVLPVADQVRRRRRRCSVSVPRWSVIVRLEARLLATGRSRRGQGMLKHPGVRSPRPSPRPPRRAEQRQVAELGAGEVAARQVVHQVADRVRSSARLELLGRLGARRRSPAGGRAGGTSRSASRCRRRECSLQPHQQEIARLAPVELTSTSRSRPSAWTRRVSSSTRPGSASTPRDQGQQLAAGGE